MGYVRRSSLRSTEPPSKRGACAVFSADRRHPLRRRKYRIATLERGLMLGFKELREHCRNECRRLPGMEAKFNIRWPTSSTLMSQPVGRASVSTRRSISQRKTPCLGPSRIFPQSYHIALIACFETPTLASIALAIMNLHTCDHNWTSVVS